MNNQRFPLNYMSSIWTPQLAFKNRKQMNWIQIFLVFILLNVLLLIPVRHHFQKVDQFSIEDYHPEIVQLLDADSIEELNQANYADGEMIVEQPFYIKYPEGVIASDLEYQDGGEVSQVVNYLIFEPNQFVLKTEGTTEIEVPYSKDFTLEHLTSEEEIVNELSRQWSDHNREELIFTFSSVVFLFIIISTTFIVFIYAYLLYLTRDTLGSTIDSYKESVNLILNLIALPTIAALIIGFARFNIVWMLAIQIVGLILMLFILYTQTKLQD